MSNRPDLKMSLMFHWHSGTARGVGAVEASRHLHVACRQLHFARNYQCALERQCDINEADLRNEDATAELHHPARKSNVADQSRMENSKQFGMVSTARAAGMQIQGYGQSKLKG